jgi:uridylate kinase
MAQYKRILLKLSGEALAGEAGFGLDAARMAEIAGEIAATAKAGVEIGMVIGGGNFFRGLEAGRHDLDRVAVDQMGMLATVMNALALQAALERLGAFTRVMSAIEMHQIAEPYIRRRAIRHLEKGRLVIFAAGTGSPYFSTDTAAALRAVEIKAELIAKATKVDGVYEQDPVKHPKARRFDRITYQEVLTRNLAVMDATAISMCRENRLPILVFNLNVKGNIPRVAAGEAVGTLITE